MKTISQLDAVEKLPQECVYGISKEFSKTTIFSFLQFSSQPLAINSIFFEIINFHSNTQLCSHLNVFAALTFSDIPMVSIEFVTTWIENRNRESVLVLGLTEILCNN